MNLFCGLPEIDLPPPLWGEGSASVNYVILEMFLTATFNKQAGAELGQAQLKLGMDIFLDTFTINKERTG